ncbi:unnamed protein product [Zymoseptoria tritici ST99CH_1E4]|uniref:Dipeptidyl-peptidase V n=1 Tax=Zymoseptoria tritici ST99CH_1E4 TaxID=1276532 RepID=A0A2H1FWK4_ZYMTR|nr:unnamed protein product [Zymoseptoria tritici ST99CH_1E4]
MATFSLAITVAAWLLPCVQAITPEQMLSAPRYSSAVPNPSGEWAVYSSTNYSFESHKQSLTWKLLHLSTGEISDLRLSAAASEIVWVGPTDTSVLYLNSTNDQAPGGVTLWTADMAQSPLQRTLVASLPAPYAGLKATRTPSGDINFIVNCLAYANNGSAYNPKLASTPSHTGRLYDNAFVRHWNTYIAQERYAVFSGTLINGSSLKGEMTNLLRGMEAAVTRPETPVQPNRKASDYDLSPDGSHVVFLTKAPELPKANYAASYLYLVPHDGSAVAQTLNGPGSTAPEAAKGASGAPLWSPDGTQIVYFQRDSVGDEADRRKIYVFDVESKEITPVAGDWDVSPMDIKWSPSSDHLYVAADYIASTKLFILPTDAAADHVADNITDITTVLDFYVLPSGEVLITANAVWASFLLYTVSPTGETKYFYKSNERDPELAGLGPDDFASFWYSGTLGDKQQAIIVKPEGFDPSKVYSLVLQIHGGPQGYAGNTWSTRWNLRTWADQGYVVVSPNPTGSTSYGQNLTDRIQGQWGGWAYEDLINAHKYACDNLAYIDCSNAVAVGGSYGGYMTNWMQGHDFGRKFKALVSHDGVASTYSLYSSDELYFMSANMNGTLWDPESRPNYAAWDPLTHANNFSTPQFIVHSELDYRLPISEGISMFNVLQTRGVPSRFLSFPDEGHFVLNRENSLFWHNEIFNWINHWTGKIDSLDDNAITQ